MRIIPYLYNYRGLLFLGTALPHPSSVVNIVQGSAPAYPHPEESIPRGFMRDSRTSRKVIILMPPILIAEDDKKTASLVALYLEREGFRTIIAYDGQQALELARRHNPIFVILDLMLPLLDGWEVCRELRRSSDVPILILSARQEEIDRVSGLTLGADDYVVKPFSPRELVARVRAILRRGRLGRTGGEQVISRGDLVLDPEKTEGYLARASGFAHPSRVQFAAHPYDRTGKSVYTR